MGSYRGVVRHVGYWRGNVHKWSTVYEFTGSLSSAFTATDAHTLLTADDAMCYSDTAADGGSFQCDLYNVATGGVPVATYVAFPWATPASWIKHSGTAWGSITGAGYVNGVKEAALAVRWPAGYSRTGKPVYFRKWYHAVCNQNVGGNVVDVPSANITSLTAGATSLQGVFASRGLSLGNSRTLAGAPTVSAYFENHQMPRGRRRRALVTAGGRYTGPTIIVPDVAD